MDPHFQYFQSAYYDYMLCSCTPLSLDWVMLAFGLVSAAIMLSVPKLFTKQMEKLGQTCANAEAQGLSHIKDILSGFDVLRAFGRTNRFINEGDSASDEMEKACCKLKHRKVLLLAV